MNFDYFNRVNHTKGFPCTLDAFLNICSDSTVLAIAKRMLTCKDKEERSKLKKQLPVITWQASYKDHVRKNANAIPSGLYIIDVDNVGIDEMKAITDKALSIKSEEKIVYIGYSISHQGVRLVAETDGRFSTIEDYQKHLSEVLNVVYDSACKDFARASYCVPDAYVIYLDQSIFQRPATSLLINPAFGKTDLTTECNAVCSQTTQSVTTTPITESHSEQETSEFQKDYKGLSLKDIAYSWLEATGGQPVEGERNQRLYNCAFSMKYICDFNEAAILHALPDCNLPLDERKSIVHSACSGPRNSTGTPKVLSEVISKMLADKELDSLMCDEDIEKEINVQVEKFADVFSTSEVPELPPIWSHFYKIAPDDFKLSCMLCLLPFLGTLGSKLRARYRGREIHSPSFIVTLEAPQAQGKSFIKLLDEICLGELKEEDARQRREEREWKDAKKMIKDLGTKLTKKEASDFMETKPEVRIRYVAPTMSVTELMRKMDAADGLHLFAMSTEIDTVYKAMKRDFSNFSDILRKAFDNDEIGQDYASETSWSGIVRLFYNCIYSGTPKAVRRFFPDVEDGLISRVLFVTIPDQTFKQGVVFADFKTKELEDLKFHLERLNKVSVFDGEPQPEHLMKMDFLAKYMMKWVAAQQNVAREQQDVTRDTFCRRSAVIGFRAGMIAFYLWGEITTPVMMKKVKNFSTWIANCALRQFLLRFKIEHDTKSTFKYKSVYDRLNDEFTVTDLQNAARQDKYRTPVRDMVYRWKLAGLVEVKSSYPLIYQKIKH